MLNPKSKMARGKNQRHSAVWGARKLIVISLGLMLAANTAFAKSPKISDDLGNADAASNVDVIVQFTQSPTWYHFNKVWSRGGTLKQDLHEVIQGAAFTVPASALEDLANDPDVAYISLDRSLQGTTTDSSTMRDYYDTAVNAQIGWQLGYDGTGIGVAVIDSGITDIPDLHNGKVYRVVYSQDFVTGASAVDVYGHGSHVAGIIGGNGKNSTGPSFSYTFKGIAPNVNLINLRVLDQNGQGSDSKVIAAINKAISLKSQYNIRVINLSLGRPVYESYTLDPLCQAVEQAWRAGIVVVVAAGNQGRNNSAGTSGYGTITAPGNDPYVITVGAMKTMGTPSRGDDQIASYSSKGPTLYDHVVKPDLVAPGNRIISLYTAGLALNKLYPGNEIPHSLYVTNGDTSPSSTYYRLSGTSMAAPMVSGTAALMLQQNPALTPDQVKARLMKTAYKTFPAFSTATDPATGVTYTSQYDIFTVGAGYLDVQAALSNTDLAPSTSGSAMSPSVAVNTSGDVYIVAGSSIIWGGSVTWGTSIVWGTSIIWGTNVSGQSVLWGSSVCWGSTATQGYSVIWGTSVVWGTTSTDATEATTVTVSGEN